MSQTDPYAQKAYWEQAGREGYTNFMYSSGHVEEHVTRRMWSIAVDIGRSLGLNPQSHVLDLGCGDGAFANRMLAQHFRAVDGVDFAEAGIARAQTEAPRPEIRFNVVDLTKFDVRCMPRYDGAFLIGILHHVKKQAPSIVRQLRDIAPRVVVLEPNGNHLLRKLLELTPAYRAAGEDSFRTRALIEMFEEAGFRTAVKRRVKSIEPAFESTPGLRAL